MSILNVFRSMNGFQEAKMLKAFKALKRFVQRSLSSLRCAFATCQGVLLELVARYQQP